MKTLPVQPSKNKFIESSYRQSLIPPYSVSPSADATIHQPDRFPEPIILRTRAAISSLAADPAANISSLGDQALSGTNQPEDRLEFKARLVRAGRIRRGDGAPGPFLIPDNVLYSAYLDGQFESLAVFVDHPGWFDSPSVKSLVGVTYESEWDQLAKGVNATVRFYATEGNHLANAIAQTLTAILEDQNAGIPVPDIGMSIVFWPDWEEGKDLPKTLKSFRKIDSADIVFSPAADGRILEALSTQPLLRPFSNKEVQPMTEQQSPYDEAVADDELLELSAPAETEPQPQAGHPQPMAQQALQSWTAAAGREAARSIVLHSNLPQISRDKLLKGSWSDPEQLYAAIEEEREYLAQLTQSNVISLKGPLPRGSDVHTKTGLDYFANAIDWIFGVEDAKTPEPQLRRMDMIYSMLTGDHEFQGVFRPQRVFLAGADTGTLANMAANAMNKIVIAQLALLTHYRWYEYVVKPTPNDGSLHDMQWTSFGGISALPVVSEGGAYDELDVDDVKEKDSWYTYGGYVGITRKMIKNSDIQRIQAVPRALAAAAIKTRSTKIAAIFSSNSGVGPTLDQDSTALFHANHSNLATTAIGSDTTAWKAAAAECFKHTEVNSSDRIGVFPKYCLVPPDLYHTALSIFGYGEGMPTSYLPFAEERGVGDPRPVVLAVPDWTDTNNWAYLADPRVWPVIHMSFSQDPSGRAFPSPELFAATSETGGLLFAADVLPIKVRDEFAYGVNGFRGIGKRNVA